MGQGAASGGQHWPSLNTNQATLATFVEAVLHQLLFARKLYPQELFATRILYQVPAFFSRHPQLNEYLNTIAIELAHLIQQGALESFLVNFVGLHGQIYDRVVFEVLVWCKYNKTWASEATEQYLKAAILQCQLCGQMLRALPTDCTFSIHIRLRPNVEEAKLKSATWIPSSNSNAPTENVTRLIPIKSVHTPDFKFQLYAQEMAIREKLPATAESCD